MIAIRDSQHSGGSYELTWLVRSVSAGNAPHEVLRNRRADVLTARTWLTGGRSIVLKMWNRPTVKGAIRRLTRTNAGYREWRALSVLHARGVAVPEPLGYFRLDETDCNHTEALMMEDLGDCSDALDHVIALREASDELQLREFEEELIELTVSIVRAGVIDVDHRVNNFLVTPAGRLVRIDLEHGVRHHLPLARQRALGTMLGTLIGSYVFAVQPDVHLAESFAHRLAERFQKDAGHALPRWSLRRAAYEARQMLRRQAKTRGVDSRIALGW